MPVPSQGHYGFHSFLVVDCLKREDFQEVKTKEASIEPSSDEEYAYTIKKKTEHKGNNKITELRTPNNLTKGKSKLIII
jgi:hypothetical protein